MNMTEDKGSRKVEMAICERCGASKLTERPCAECGNPKDADELAVWNHWRADRISTEQLVRVLRSEWKL